METPYFDMAIDWVTRPAKGQNVEKSIDQWAFVPTIEKNFSLKTRACYRKNMNETDASFCSEFYDV